jgi:hypothetical protein
MSKCSNCHSNNVNENKGNARLAFWLFALLFFLLAIDFIRKKEGLDLAGVAFVISIILFYVGKRRVVYNYYCNNCRNKWTKGEWD